MNDVCIFCHLIMVPPWSQVCGAKLRDPSPQQGDVAQVLGSSSGATVLCLKVGDREAKTFHNQRQRRLRIT